MQCGCGLTMTQNPHPDAGLPARVAEVGAVWVCIPCTVGALHRSSAARYRAEADLASAKARAREAAWLIEEANPRWSGIAIEWWERQRAFLAGEDQQ
jgi:hypothetical protein